MTQGEQESKMHYVAILHFIGGDTLQYPVRSSDDPEGEIDTLLTSKTPWIHNENDKRIRINPENVTYCEMITEGEASRRSAQAMVSRIRR